MTCEACARTIQEALVALETAKARLEGESVRSIVAERSYDDVDEAIGILETLLPRTPRASSEGGATEK